MSGFEKLTGLSKKKTRRGRRGKGKGAKPAASPPVMPTSPTTTGSKSVLWKALKSKTAK